MRFSALAVLACFTGAANAHFRLLYPEPRGAFVADQEPSYCGGYINAANNRSSFPLSGGFINIKTGHAGFTVGVLISTAQNPISFDNFTVDGHQQLAKAYAKEASAGTFCIPLNISAVNIAGVKDGSNVTIQIVFEGGDGNLYQCADLTLSSNLTIASTCVNETAVTSSSSTGTTTTSAGNTQNTSGALGRAHQLFGYAAIILGFGGVLLSLL